MWDVFWWNWWVFWQTALYSHSLPKEQISKIEGVHPWSNRINGFGSLVLDWRPLVCHHVICLLPSLTPGQTSDTLLWLVCSELQLSYHSSSLSPLCPYSHLFLLCLPLSPYLIFCPHLTALPGILQLQMLSEVEMSRRICRVAFQKHCSLS